jgi:uncharacterized membrane protein YhdT
MAGDDSRSVGIAAILLAIVDAALLYVRLTGNSVFQLIFEAFVFYFPLLLLVLYWVYLRMKLPKP